MTTIFVLVRRCIGLFGLILPGFYVAEGAEAVAIAGQSAALEATNPALRRFGLDEQTAPRPPATAALETKLPLVLKQGDHVVLIGNTLFERGAQFPHFEALVQQAHPALNLVMRTLAWSADEVDLMPRPANFGDLHQHLAAQKADVVFAAFGFNESFGGLEGLPAFRRRLAAFLSELKGRAYNGRAGPRIVLVSPIANENVPEVPAAELNNARLAAYTRAMGEVAVSEKVGFVNLFDAMQRAIGDPVSNMTFNGVHLEDAGYALLAESLFRLTFDRPAPSPNADLRAAIADKNRQFFRRYRPLNGFYYTGGRNEPYGYLDFLPAMQSFDQMVANRDRRIWQLVAGKPAGVGVDDSNVPLMPPVPESRGANEWLSAAAELAAFKIDPRFEVNLFASEEQFPEMAKPIQMRWDTRGRLWVSCSTTYPHAYPGQEPADRLLILEDVDGDGRADTCQVFADDLNIPLSFEFGDGGVYVSEQPYLTFLKDTDGDNRADFRRQVLAGFGTEDSHHALHDFVRTPDGDLMFRESIFLHSQIETAHGPVRTNNSSWFRLETAKQRLTAFGSYPSTNPWGVAFDDWGRHVASHPIFASAFQATNPPYPGQHPPVGAIPAYSGTCGHEFVDSPIWPEEFRGAMIKARYKPTNRIEILQWRRKDDHFEEKYVSDLIFSSNLSFIPVDVKFGPRGDLYICDWYNPIKGHAQYSLRDPRRDRKAGRIWRIVPKQATLPVAPVIAGAPIPALVELLKSSQYRLRDLAKRELVNRNPAVVLPALDRWTQALDRNEPRYRHHQLEAIWMYRSLGSTNPALLRELLACDNQDARAAATQQLRYSGSGMADALDRLRERASDPSGLVRMEAVIAASYLGTIEALAAVVGALELPADAHLQYAIRTSLESAALVRHWKDNAAFLEQHPQIPAFLERQAASSRRTVRVPARAEWETVFDRQPDLLTVRISSVPERMLFDVTRFEVKPGQAVRLIFSNPDAMQHNLVVVKPGALEEIGLAGNAMAGDPDGIKNDFVPRSDKVLQATKLVDPGGRAFLRFTAPKEPGNYPYVCTFPGHWVIMNGIMVVRR